MVNPRKWRGKAKESVCTRCDNKPVYFASDGSTRCQDCWDYDRQYFDKIIISYDIDVYDNKYYKKLGDGIVGRINTN